MTHERLAELVEHLVKQSWDAIPTSEAVDRIISLCMEEAARVAESWEPAPKLLVMAGQLENDAAFVGQHEAGERIASAIRALATPEGQ